MMVNHDLAPGIDNKHDTPASEFVVDVKSKKVTIKNMSGTQQQLKYLI